jgi:hypothetical protein
MKLIKMFNHQDTKGTKKIKNIFGLVFPHQIFAFFDGFSLTRGLVCLPWCPWCLGGSRYCFSFGVSAVMGGES